MPGRIACPNHKDKKSSADSALNERKKSRAKKSTRHTPCRPKMAGERSGNLLREFRPQENSLHVLDEFNQYPSVLCGDRVLLPQQGRHFELHWVQAQCRQFRPRLHRFVLHSRHLKTEAHQMQSWLTHHGPKRASLCDYEEHAVSVHRLYECGRLPANILNVWNT